MSQNLTDETAEAADANERDRYTDIALGEGEYVVYDRTNHRAWIQSTATVAIDDLR